MGDTDTNQVTFEDGKEFEHLMDLLERADPNSQASASKMLTVELAKDLNTDGTTQRFLQGLADAVEKGSSRAQEYLVFLAKSIAPAQSIIMRDEKLASMKVGDETLASIAAQSNIFILRGLVKEHREGLTKNKCGF